MSVKNVLRWYRLAAVVGALATLLLVPAATVYGQDTGTVAQLVEFPGGELKPFCRDLETPTDNITALKATGLDLAIKDWGWGLTLCAIEGLGCPEDNCWCECPLPECKQWTFFRWSAANRAWETTEDTTIQAGDVVAWLWTELDTTVDYPWPPAETPSLQNVTLNKICELEEEQRFLREFVPEPGTVLLLGGGLAGLAGYAGLKLRASREEVA
ncbi:MAG: PEP-CTERM sorting domain-containing protein [Dehalococcoidia bacterium]|nr:PEP-CTERM sorting domain-containing protein [Dehalococcoidia bacterium]